MGKPTTPVEKVRRISPYARKMALRASGGHSDVVVFEDLRKGLPELPPWPQRKEAVVEKPPSLKGYVFLRTAKGERVFLNLKLLRPTGDDRKILEGCVLDCEIDLDPKGLNVTRVHSISPPPT